MYEEMLKREEKSLYLLVTLGVISLIQPRLEQADKSTQRTPVIVMHASALRSVFVWRKVFADVTVRAVLAKEERIHLRRKRFSPFRNYRGCRVLFVCKCPVRELRHWAPDVPTPVAQRRERGVVGSNRGQPPVAIVVVSRKWCGRIGDRYTKPTLRCELRRDARLRLCYAWCTALHGVQTCR